MLGSRPPLLPLPGASLLMHAHEQSSIGTHLMRQEHLAHRLLAIGVRGKQEQADLLGYNPRDRILSRRRSRQLAANSSSSSSSSSSANAAALARPRQAEGDDAGAGGAGGGLGAASGGGEALRGNYERQAVDGQQQGRTGGGAAGGQAQASKGNAFLGSASVDMTTPFACGSFKNAYVGTMNGIKICVLRHRGEV
jgi:hypothetical protein